VHDAVALETRGIPVAAVITEPFAHVFAQTAGLLGAEGLRAVAIPHPLAALDEKEIRARAEQAVKQIAARLTEEG
jgi:hypothetical protein